MKWLGLRGFLDCVEQNQMTFPKSHAVNVTPTSPPYHGGHLIRSPCVTAWKSQMLIQWEARVVHRVVLKADAHTLCHAWCWALAITPSRLTVGCSGSLRSQFPRVQSILSFHFGKLDAFGKRLQKKQSQICQQRHCPCQTTSEPGLPAAEMKGLEVQPAVPGTECCPEHLNEVLPVAQGNQEEECNDPGGWKLSWVGDANHSCWNPKPTKQDLTHSHY